MKPFDDYYKDKARKFKTGDLVLINAPNMDFVGRNGVYYNLDNKIGKIIDTLGFSMDGLQYRFAIRFNEGAFSIPVQYLISLSDTPNNKLKQASDLSNI